MKRRHVSLDEETDRVLNSLAKVRFGNRSKAVRELVKTYRTTEEMLDTIELIHAGSLSTQKRRSEAAFRQGRFTTWEEVKRRNNL